MLASGSGKAKDTSGGKASGGGKELHTGKAGGAGPTRKNDRPQRDAADEFARIHGAAARHLYYRHDGIVSYRGLVPT